MTVINGPKANRPSLSKEKDPQYSQGVTAMLKNTLLKNNMALMVAQENVESGQMEKEALSNWIDMLCHMLYQDR